MHRPRRRWLNTRILNPGFQPFRHQVGKICGVGKKGEHQLNWERHPIAGFETLRHSFDGIARSGVACEHPESKVLCRMRGRKNADPSTHHPQAPPPRAKTALLGPRYWKAFGAPFRSEERR